MARFLMQTGHILEVRAYENTEEVFKFYIHYSNVYQDNMKYNIKTHEMKARVNSGKRRNYK